MMSRLGRLLKSPPDLPVARQLPRVERELPTGALVIQAPPGTGKTTLIPPLVAEYLAKEHTGTAPHGETGRPPRVIVTQPRRVAVRAAARRIAALLGESVGQTVGFSVRGESKVGQGTRIEMVTPGVLVRRLQRDPELPGVGAVILDEVHERHLDSDLALALAIDVRDALREDLLLIAMSATVAAERTADLLGGTVVDIPGEVHPLDIRWAPPARGFEALGVVGRGTGVRREFLTHVTSVVRRALSDVPAGDVLVFAPGVREVEEIAGQLRGCGAEVATLYGSLPTRQQDRVLSERTDDATRSGTVRGSANERAAGTGTDRRVIVATSVAESSLTVPGVRIVVDSGLSREPRTDYGRGISGLVTVYASQAAGTQRAGRAGRTGPGTVYRCMDETSWARRPAQSEPEIRTADLTGFVLEAACWGAVHTQGLALLDEPMTAAVTAAEELLRSLGALDNEGRATSVGQQLALLPLSPRLGKALLTARTRRAVEMGALLEEDLRIPGADLAGGWRRASAASPTWKQQVRRLEKLVLDLGHKDKREQGGGDDDIAVVVASAYPERLARLRPGSGRYQLANGTGAVLPEHSALEGEKWLAIAQLERPQGRADAAIRAAVALDEPLALRLGEAQLHSATAIIMRNGRLYERLTRSLGAIELSAHDSPCTDGRAAARWLAEEMAAGRFSLTWSDGARLLRERMAFLCTTVGEPWPDVTDEALASRLDEWAGLEIERFVAGGKLTDVTADQLERLFPWPDALHLDELAPQRINVPTGYTARVDYSSGRPVVRLRVQEAFGWSETPRVAGVPVTLELLSPAQRPVAVSDDLRSFWAGPYAQVRAEMRGRYPRHPWPEDPASATPTRRSKPRK